MFCLVKRNQSLIDWLIAIDQPKHSISQSSNDIKSLGKLNNKRNRFFLFVLPEQGGKKSEQWYEYK